MANKKEYLTFKIGKEEFGVEILRVQEIRGWEKPSPLPNVPPFVKGVVDLRGLIVPILDLRNRFNLQANYSHTTVVIVVRVELTAGERVIGLVVDAVSDVQSIDIDNLQDPPEVSNSVDSQFILGLTTIHEVNTQQLTETDPSKRNKGKGKMVIILDIDRLASESLLSELTARQ